MRDIELRLREFLNNRRQDGHLELDTILFSDGTIDSIGLIALISFLEETYAIQVDQADVTLENFDTIQRVLDYVQTKVGR